MRIDASDVAVCAAVGVFGIVGLLLASRSVDDEMYVFGLSLAAFAVLFVFAHIHGWTAASAPAAAHASVASVAPADSVKAPAAVTKVSADV